MARKCAGTKVSPGEQVSDLSSLITQDCIRQLCGTNLNEGREEMRAGGRKGGMKKKKKKWKEFTEKKHRLFYSFTGVILEEQGDEE